MSRIRKAFEVRFRELLDQVHARKVDRGVQWLFRRAEQLQTSTGQSPTEALARVQEGLAERLRRRPVTGSAAAPVRFFCDAGLGGLARWLRAAGHEAYWVAGIDDAVLVRRAREMSAIILTTDSMLMERRLIRDHILEALWLPPTLKIPAQLILVFKEFNLCLRPSRCMSCGGELRMADKEALRERIPPRTYRWRNEFFVCACCEQVFWHGTHWERIQNELRRVQGLLGRGAPDLEGQRRQE